MEVDPENDSRDGSDTSTRHDVEGIALDNEAMLPEFEASGLWEVEQL
jgi:hypothetical protein